METPNKPSGNLLGKISHVLHGAYQRFNKLFDRIIFHKVGSLIVSLILSIVICVGIDYQNIRIELFNDMTTVENLGNITVDVLYNEDTYEISGIPSSVEVTLTGQAPDIQIYRQEHPNLHIEVDLRQYVEGSYIVNLQLSNLPSTITASISPETVTATVTPKETRTFTVTPELIVGTGQSASDFETPELSQNTVSIRATEDDLNAIRYVRAIVDVSSFTEGDSTTLQAMIVAYDADGNRVQVQIDPTTVEVTVNRTDS